MKKDCEPLSPSFKVRILIPLPRENRHPHGCLFFSSIEKDKDSKNRYYEAKPSNKVIGSHSKSVILQMGDVLITGL